MGLVFSQTTDGQVIAIPVGTTVGRVLLTRHDVTLAGTGAGCVLKTDGVAGNLITAAFPPQTLDGQPVRSFTLADCTLDLDDQAGLTAALAPITASGPLTVTLLRVWVRGHRGVAFQASGTLLVGAGLDIRGSGTAVKLVNGGSAVLRDVTVVGGAGGLITDASACPRVELADWDVNLQWWQAPTGEAPTVSEVRGNVVTLTHESGSRGTTDSLRALVAAGTWPATTPHRHQRLVAASGVWGHLVDGALTWHAAGSWAPASAPASATIYDVVLGRTASFTATTVTVPRWRGPAGALCPPPPVGATWAILRAGVDVDAGALHLQDATDGAQVRRFRQYGGFSDGLTVRGNDCVIEDCESTLAQDMGSTNGGDAQKGRNTWRRCDFRSAGYGGAYVCAGEGPRYERCRFSAIGTQGSLGHGVIDDSGAAQVVGCTFAANLGSDIRTP